MMIALQVATMSAGELANLTGKYQETEVVIQRKHSLFNCIYHHLCDQIRESSPSLPEEFVHAAVLNIV